VRVLNKWSLSAVSLLEAGLGLQVEVHGSGGDQIVVFGAVFACAAGYRN